MSEFWNIFKKTAYFRASWHIQDVLIDSYNKIRYDLEKGYNLVTGKLSFEISNILDPQKFSPTLVATDISRLAVVDNEKLRRLTNTD